MTGDVVPLPVVHRSREAELDAEAFDALADIFPEVGADSLRQMQAELRQRGYRIVRFVQNGPPQ